MTQAIFLSYASQDTDAARRICDAMRGAGLQVWFDQSELRGGDAWDASIRKQIKECSLFVPIISASTNARSEGYFRLEWKLAVDRSHLMAESKAFFVPIIIDDTSEPSANVPDAFRTRQWSRVSDENAVNAFAARIAKLVDGSAPSSIDSLKSAPAVDLRRIAQTVAAPSGIGIKLAIAFAVAAAISAGIYLVNPHQSTNAASTSAPSDARKSAAINPLSVMVMPFANQTGDNEKAYIADALTSSITSDLTRIRDAFIVPAATAFSLQATKFTVPQLGKEAAVRFVLTGNVTGDKERLRINAVLSDTQTGAQLWSEVFDGKQTDLFALQDQVTNRISNSIGPQMIIVAARDSEKRSSKPEVADLLMRVKAQDLNQQSLKNLKMMEALLRQALVIEPDNVKAKAALASTLANQVANFDHELKLDKDGRVALAKESLDIALAVREIDPQQPTVYHPIATYATIVGDLRGAVQAYRQALELLPKSWRAYNVLGLSLIRVGEAQEATEVLEKGLQFASPARPPAEIYGLLSWAAFIADHPDTAIEWAQKAVSASPDRSLYRRRLALAYALKGDRSQATKAAAEALRLDPMLGLSRSEGLPWPGKEQQYQKHIETKFLPAWRLAGLPE